jgi:hypothetical protein
MFGGNRLGGCEKSTCLMLTSLDSDKFARLVPCFEISAHLGVSQLAHCATAPRSHEHCLMALW